MPLALLSWIHCNFMKYLFIYRAFVPLCIAPPLCHSITASQPCCSFLSFLPSPLKLCQWASQCHNALGPNTIRRASQAHLTHQSLHPPMHTLAYTIRKSSTSSHHLPDQVTEMQFTYKAWGRSYSQWQTHSSTTSLIKTKLHGSNKELFIVRLHKSSLLVKFMFSPKIWQ